MTRHDVTAEAVVTLYFQGMSLIRIAARMACGVPLIQSRLKKGRELYPHLPWAERKPDVDRTEGVVNWVQLMDGRPGERAAKGSIVPPRKGTHR